MDKDLLPILDEQSLDRFLAADRQAMQDPDTTRRRDWRKRMARGYNQAAWYLMGQLFKQCPDLADLSVTQDRPKILQVGLVGADDREFLDDGPGSTAAAPARRRLARLWSQHRPRLAETIDCIGVHTLDREMWGELAVLVNGRSWREAHDHRQEELAAQALADRLSENLPASTTHRPAGPRV